MICLVKGCMFTPQKGMTTMATEKQQSKGRNSNCNTNNCNSLSKTSSVFVPTKLTTTDTQPKNSSHETWSPVMDGIIPLPPSLAAEANWSNAMQEKLKNFVDEHINDALYGPRKMHRLPVFEKIYSTCPHK
ncbi:unnamed protein product [Camellia sinensis]